MCKNNIKCGMIIHPEELTENMTEQIIGSKVQVLGLHPTGGATADESLSRLIELMKDEAFLNKLSRLRENGIAIEYEFHALSYLLPRSEFEKHPEWFRVNENGERCNDFNMCASNPEALAFITERARQLALIFKSDTGRYAFWIDDMQGKSCSCEKCSVLSPADQAMLIYNAILAGIKMVDGKAKQCYLAYQDQMEAPQTVKPDKDIYLEFAPMRKNTLEPFAESAANEGFLKPLPKLLEVFGKSDARALEYWLDNSLFSDWKKPARLLKYSPEVIEKDISFYLDCGFEFITSFACFLSDDYSENFGQPPLKEYVECFNEALRSINDGI